MEKQYYLFGQNACEILQDQGVEALKEYAKTGKKDWTYFCASANTTAEETLRNFVGHKAYLEISEELYSWLWLLNI